MALLGSAVIFLRYCCGLCYPCGILMVLLWDYCDTGVAVEMLWYYGPIVAVLKWIPVGLMWNFPWHCLEIAVIVQ